MLLQKRINLILCIFSNKNYLVGKSTITEKVDNKKEKNGQINLILIVVYKRKMITEKRDEKKYLVKTINACRKYKRTTGN